MIKATELRIGNFVHPVSDGPVLIPETGIYLKVLEIALFQAKAIPHNLKAAELVDWPECRYNLLAPIPLTPELLEKAGFRKNHPATDWLRLGIFAFMFHDRGLLFEFRNLAFPAPQYLHQLQNLYFALTGEELKIEL